ncbi:mitochondrial import protein Pam17 [Elsinoe ampelina]|uniref:Presequence translocated-associated motor subunit PAM17 n=1 Tax=Elsinoe ampelina TaxID=302913 RepID=A0A6A6G8Z6_9PEZI|nr:mitochondrial import protein Pam17 [Elsinoe ampelina]
MPQSQTTSICRSSNRKLSSVFQRAAFSTSTARRDVVSAQQSPNNEPPQLAWNDFLKMRRTRRYVNLVTSVGTALGSVGVTVPLALQYELDNQIASVTGLDPFLALGLTITAVGGFGWLMGPFVGNAGFLLWNRRIKDSIGKKERDFYNHIKRHRADPTSSSVNNPVPDYYGEKIGSVADYRRWLKDQRAFNRKKNKNLL